MGVAVNVRVPAGYSRLLGVLLVFGLLGPLPACSFYRDVPVHPGCHQPGEMARAAAQRIVGAFPERSG